MPRILKVPVTSLVTAFLAVVTILPTWLLRLRHRKNAGQSRSRQWWIVPEVRIKTTAGPKLVVQGFG